MPRKGKLILTYLLIIHILADFGAVRRVKIKTRAKKYLPNLKAGLLSESVDIIDRNSRKNT